MTKYAWIENDRIRDVVSADPYTLFHPDVAVFYDTSVSDDVEPGWSLVDGTWTAPPPAPIPEPVSAEPPRRKQLSAPEFKLQFTVTERLSIKAARNAPTDATAGQLEAKAVLDDWFDILDDPRLTTVDLDLPQTLEGLDFLVTLGVLTQARRDEIALGVEET